MSGVYGIINKVNGKIYIGSTSSTFEKRFGIHKRQLRLGIHGNSHLQASWNKYGENSFEFKVLEECTPEFCIVLENWWIEHYAANDRNKGYNKRDVADSNFGIKRSEETKRRQSLIASNRSQEVRENMAAAQRGKVCSAETRAKMSNSHRGKKCSEEKKLKISTSRKSAKVDGSVKLVEYSGKSQSIATWARDFSLSPNIVYRRLARGWSIERALETPRRGKE